MLHATRAPRSRHSRPSASASISIKESLLLATVFPLVIALLAMGAMLALPLKVVFPAMVVLGPLMMLRYLYWRRRRGPELTTRRYLLEDRWHRRGLEQPRKRIAVD